MKPHREPDSFKPALWGAVVNGEFVLLLVCDASQRAMTTGKTPDGGISCKSIHHPVAIQLGSPASILYGFRITENEWHIQPIEKSGIHRQYAQKALAEAWRGVEEITWGAYPERKWNFRFQVNMIRSIGDCKKPTEKTMFRNVNAWIRWGLWDEKNLSRVERAQELCAMGIPCDKKKLNKMVENADV